jgi:ApbE superfamily uncharacterized protein (UPF0280 family)
MFMERTYRNTIAADDLHKTRLCIGESDILLYVGKRKPGANVDTDIKDLAERSLLKHRRKLREYIRKDPLFLSTLEPYAVHKDAPDIVRKMALAGYSSGTGPMAAVAGAIAQAVGSDLLGETEDVILENGGDIFMKTTSTRRLGIFAGDSPFTGSLILSIRPEMTPLGICTSSGTVGHSLSFGSADAVVVTSGDAALADAVATALGNMVKTQEDISAAIQRGQEIPGVLGLVIVKGDKMGAWGHIEFAGQRR